MSPHGTQLSLRHQMIMKVFVSLARANRWCRQDKKRIQLDQPSLVQTITSEFRESIARTRILQLNKKNDGCFCFFNLCDIALSNTWILYEKSQPHSTVYMKLHQASKYTPDFPYFLSDLCTKNCLIVSNTAAKLTI